MFLFKNRKYSSQQEEEIAKFLKNILELRAGNILLYRTALIHRSKSHIDDSGYKVNNERLEYLGDAVLSSIVGEYLFKKYPHQGEGFLTEMRSKMVSRQTLNAIAKKIGLSDLIERDKGLTAGAGSIGGNTFEAMTGALYLDKGYKKSYDVLINRIFTVYIDVESLENKLWNYKGKMIDWGQKNKRKVSFEVLGTESNTYRKLYNVQIAIDDQAFQTAQDFSIKAAEQLASEKAYNALIEKGIIK